MLLGAMLCFPIMVLHNFLIYVVKAFQLHTAVMRLIDHIDVIPFISRHHVQQQTMK